MHTTCPFDIRQVNAQEPLTLRAWHISFRQRNPRPREKIFCPSIRPSDRNPDSSIHAPLRSSAGSLAESQAGQVSGELFQMCWADPLRFGLLRSSDLPEL